MRKKKKVKKELKKKHGILLYSAFVKFTFLIYLIAFLLSLKDEYPLFDLKRFLIAFAIITVITVVFYCLRRLCIGYKMMFDLDVRTVYELDRRKMPLCKKHNLKLLYGVYFYEGDFLKAMSVCDEIFACTKNKKSILEARHIKILSMFFVEDTKAIFELIERQRELKAVIKNSAYNYMFKEYLFIEEYLKSNYEKALENVISLLDDEKVNVCNSRTICFQQFQKMVCIKKGDVQGVQNCNLEILKCDPKRRTFFSKSIVS